MLPFTISSPIPVNQDQTGHISSDMANYAVYIARHEGLPLERFAQVYFKDSNIHQYVNLPYCNSTLLFCCRFEFDLGLLLLVRLHNDDAVIAAGILQSDRKIIIPPVYQKSNVLHKLTVAQIKQIFDEVFEHLPTFFPKPD